MSHIHTWILPRPNGPMALGKCIECKKTAEFPNAHVVSNWSCKKKAKPIFDEDMIDEAEQAIKEGM